MNHKKLSRQLHDHLISLISLGLALIALLYTSWREEQTERNRNVRPAAFEVLKHLGELQIIINYTHFQPKNSLADPFMGWGHVSLIRDLCYILPPPLPEESQQLVDIWAENWEKIRTSKSATEAITKEVDTMRESVVQAMLQLR